jgi:hypothetical protein
VIRPVRVSSARVLYTFGPDGRYRSEWAIGDDGDLYTRDPDAEPRRRRDEWEHRTRAEEAGSPFVAALRAILEANTGPTMTVEYVEVLVSDRHERAMRGEVIRD